MVDHGEEAHGVAVFEGCAERGVCVDFLDFCFEFFGFAGTCSGEDIAREGSAGEVVHYWVARSSSCDDGAEGMCATS